ncbi:MAG TPA: cbb3-type cytochrome c oxidase subunit 3 [Ramlibacter sp.]|jgi:cytochrome c oxidase cbb3-type subunit 4
MDINTLRIAATVACFVTFVGILAWAYARRNKSFFEDAAQIPFTND